MAKGNLNDFVTRLGLGGARANQYEVSISGVPEMDRVKSTLPFLCRSTQIPAMTVGEVAVPYRGRQVFIAGDRTYDAWTITVLADGNWALRNAFEIWQKRIAQIDDDTSGELTPRIYYATALVAQLNREGGRIGTYELFQCWPQTIDAIDLAYDTNDAVMEFGVTLRFNWME